MAKAPRVVLASLFGDERIPLGASCVDGLREIGCEVRTVDTATESPLHSLFFKPANRLLRGLGIKGADVSRGTPWERDAFRESLLEKAVADFRPDVLIVLIGHRYDPEFIHGLKARYGVRCTVGWWVENPREINQPMLDDARTYDRYYCIHRYGYDETSGIEYLPAYGVDKCRYYPAAQRRFEHEAVFVGAWSQRREEYFSRIADLPVAIYGPGWEKKSSNPALRAAVKARKIWGDDLLRLYHGAKVVLNVSSWPPERSGLNLRVVDIPATGAFLLTDDSEDLRNLLVPGEEVGTFTTPEDFRQKLCWYLGHDAEREAVARRGCDKVNALETYAEKMRKVMGAAGFDLPAPSATEGDAKWAATT